MEKISSEVRTFISKVWEVKQMANEIMFYGGIAGAVLFGIGAIILFFVFRIHTVIGELTGITAKRSIRKIQKEGYEGQSKISAIRENTDQIVAKRGRTTGRLQPKTKKQVAFESPNMQDETVVLNQPLDDQTTVLNQMYDDQTTVLNQTYDDQTTVLNQGIEAETTVLQQPQIQFEMEEDVVVTHTEERI